MDPFEKQNIFNTKMIEDYKAGMIPHSSVFEPYFKWKAGEESHKSITKDKAFEMMEEANNLLEDYYEKYPNACKNMDTYVNDDPWQEYKGYGEDKYLVSYLEGIEEELTNLIFILE